jgi:hypothetical protein
MCEEKKYFGKRRT